MKYSENECLTDMFAMVLYGSFIT